MRKPAISRAIRPLFPSLQAIAQETQKAFWYTAHQGSGIVLPDSFGVMPDVVFDSGDTAQWTNIPGFLGGNDTGIYTGRVEVPATNLASTFALTNSFFIFWLQAKRTVDNAVAEHLFNVQSNAANGGPRYAGIEHRLQPNGTVVAYAKGITDVEVTRSGTSANALIKSGTAWSVANHISVWDYRVDGDATIQVFSSYENGNGAPAYAMYQSGTTTIDPADPIVIPRHVLTPGVPLKPFLTIRGKYRQDNNTYSNAPVAATGVRRLGFANFGNHLPTNMTQVLVELTMGNCIPGWEMYKALREAWR